MSREKLQLSAKDRIFLSNQYRILEKLYPEDAESFKKNQEIVDSGYEAHYDSLNVSVMECRITSEQCNEVRDILEMYRALYNSYTNLGNNQISKTEIQFPGFDGNGERGAEGYLGYARFLIQIEGKWQETLEDRPQFDVNSHSSVLDMYRRMLNAWQKTDKKIKLSLTEMESILAEKTHPSNR